MKHPLRATITRAGRLGGGVGALLLVASVAGAQKPTASIAPVSSVVPAERETASFQAGGIVFWLRATDAGKVLVYAARGFRTPFAHPSTLSADDTDKWAELAASLLAAADGTGPMPVVRSAPAGGGAGLSAAAVLGGGDLLLDVPDAAASPTVNVRIGASGPEALTATLSAAVLREVVPALRESARAAREMAAAHARAGVAGVARATRALAAAGAALRSGPPAPPAPSGQPSPPVTAPTVAAGATIPDTRPVVALSAVPAAVITPVAGATTVGSVAPAPPGSPRPDASPIAAAPIAHVAAMAGTASGVANLRDTARVSVSSGLASSAVGNAVRQRQPLLAYCYTAFGLATDSTLNGRATVEVALNETGAVTRADIVDRHWWGRGAERVESCVRQRVMAWRFPPAPKASVQDVELYFNH